MFCCHQPSCVVNRVDFGLFVSKFFPILPHAQILISRDRKLEKVSAAKKDVLSFAELLSEESKLAESLMTEVDIVTVINDLEALKKSLIDECREAKEMEKKLGLAGLFLLFFFFFYQSFCFPNFPPPPPPPESASSRR